MLTYHGVGGLEAYHLLRMRGIQVHVVPQTFSFRRQRAEGRLQRDVDCRDRESIKVRGSYMCLQERQL